MEKKFEKYAGCSMSEFIKVNKPLWRNLLFSYSRGDLDLIDDIISDSLLNIIQYIDSYDDSKSKFSTWCYKIVLNSCKNNFNSKKIEYINYDYDYLSTISYYEEDVDEDILYSDENYLKVIDIIDRIKLAKQREIIKMKYIDGLSIEDISKHFNMNVNTVKSHLLNGRKKIQREFFKNKK